MSNNFIKAQIEVAADKYEEAENQLRDYIQQIQEQKPQGTELALCLANLEILKARLNMCSSVFSALTMALGHNYDTNTI